MDEFNIHSFYHFKQISKINQSSEPSQNLFVIFNILKYNLKSGKIKLSSQLFYLFQRTIYLF